MANKKPQIKITVDPTTVKVGEVVTIDPMGSSDPDDQIINFSGGVLNATVQPIGVVFSEPGQYEVFGRIEDAKHKTDTATAIVTVTADEGPDGGGGELEIAPATLAPMQVGAPVDVTLEAAGGTAPYTFAVLSGALPPGVTLAAGGRLAGTPTAAGLWAADVMAGDAVGAAGTIGYDGTVAEAAAPAGIVITPATFPAMTVGAEVSFGVVATGGGGGFLYRVSQGAMPAGVTLAIDGKVRGTPTTGGLYTVEVVATDAYGAWATQLYTGTVAEVVIPPADETLLEADFEYRGAYRLPNDSAALCQFAYGGIAGRKVNGKVRLFKAIDEVTYHGAILEFEVPTVPPSKDVATCPQMTRVRWWGDVYGGRRGTYLQVTSARESVRAVRALADTERDPARAQQMRDYVTRLEAWIAAHEKDGAEWTWWEFAVGFSGIGTLYWDEPSKRLFWTYADFYNVSGRPDWGLGASTLNDATTEGAADSFVADGPWRFACPTGAGWTAYGPWRGNGLIVRQDTDELIVCSSLMSGNIGSPWGPCAYGGGRLPAPGAPWDIDLMQPIRYLDHYPMLGYLDENGRILEGHDLTAFRRRTDLPFWEPSGSAALNINNGIYGYDSWREVDGSGLVAWLDNVNGKSGVVYAGSCCGTNVPGIPDAGHEGYVTGLNNFMCSHGLTAPLQITGPVSWGNFSCFLSYRVPDLLRVAAGEIPDYSPEPTMFMNLQKKWGLAGGSPLVMGANNALYGSYFDRETRLLYMIAPLAEYYTIPGIGAPVIHVVRIGGA